MMSMSITAPMAHQRWIRSTPKLGLPPASIQPRATLRRSSRAGTITDKDWLDIEAGIAALKDRVPTLVVTCSADGAVAYRRKQERRENRSQISGRPVLVPCDSLIGTNRDARFSFGSKGRRLSRRGSALSAHVAAVKASGRRLVWLKELSVALEGGRDSFLIADGGRVLQEPADDGDRERSQLARRSRVGAVRGEADRTRAVDHREAVA